MERFSIFPSSSSDVPVIPTSSPLSPDGKHRRTSPSTASGNPPAPVTSVPVSPLPPHRTKARYLSGCVRATPVLPKAGLAAPPHGRKRQTPLSPAGERASPDRPLPAARSSPHPPFASKYRDNRIRRLAPRLVGIQHHADRCRISFQQSNVPRTKRRPAQRHRMPESRRMHRQHILISFHQKDAPLPADRLPCLIQPVQQFALPIQPARFRIDIFRFIRSSSDNLRAANPANRPSSSRTGNTNRFRIAFQRSGTRQGDCPTPKSNQVGVSSEHPLPAGSNKARKASFSIDNWELTTGNCSASLFSFFSLIANRSGNNLASLLSFPSIANCPL